MHGAGGRVVTTGHVGCSTRGMGNNGHQNRDRMFDDHDEGNRRGDHPQQSIERGGQGQSGYTAGRSERDRSLDTQSYNQGYGSSGQRDRHDIGADDRFSGRGGGDYTDERMGFSRNGGDERMNYSRGGYPRSNEWASDRSPGSSTDRAYRTDPRSRHEHNSRGDRGPRGDVRGYSHQFSDDPRTDLGRYDQSGNDEHLGGYNGQSIHGDYGQSESERGVWSTQVQRGGRQQGSTDNNSGWGQGVNQYGQRFEQPSQGQGVSHRGKGPQGWTRSDEKIKDIVCEALHDDHHIDASGIDVEVKNGEVTLTGMVPDRRTKRAAEDLVERLSGVKDVQNSLKVSSDERMKYAQKSSSETSSQQPSNGKDSKKAQA